MNFPEFMFNDKNKIPMAQQNTPDIEGYYYTANDGSQMAFWIYKADRELFIPKGSMQDGRVKAGTRSIHAFGGQG